MNIRLLKSSKELERFEKDIGIRHYSSPNEYPCIAISAINDVLIDWKSTGHTHRFSYNVEFLYPKDIQKELYDNDFEDLVKK